MTSAPQSAPVASIERRFYAFVLDRLIAWSLLGAAGVAAWWWFFRDDEVLPGVLVVVGAVLLVGLAFAIPLGVSGTSPGKSAFGMRVVNPETGTPIGVGRALLRTVILGAATLPLFGLGTAVLAWTAVEDRARERRGWHDHKAHSIVVDVRPVEVAAAAAEDERPRHVVNLTAMRLMPVRQSAAPAAPVLPAPVARSTATPRDLGTLEPQPVQPDPFTSAVPAALPADRREPAGPSPQRAPQQQPAPQGGQPTPGAPPSVPPGHPDAAGDPRAVRPLTPAPAPPPFPHAAGPSAGTTPPAPSAGRPETTPRRGRHSSDGDGGPHRDDAAATARRTTWRVVFDSGESFVVEGLGLVGRRPEGRAGEPVRHVVPLVSQNMSISKTHAQFHLAGDGALVVMDRGSTNGSILIRRGVSRELSSGRPATLLDGDRVLFGDREMRVTREQA